MAKKGRDLLQLINMKYPLFITVLSTFVSCGQVETKTKAKVESKSGMITEESDDVQLNDTTVTFLWRDMKYDSSLNDSFNSIFINQDYLNSMSNAEKAALGYVATFIGNECWWDGDANQDRSNLDCKVISALGLGYQCSDKHLGFLRKRFSTDKPVLSELEKDNCPTTPYTATIQDSFDEIIVKTKGSLIMVEYRVSAVNLREGQSSQWSESVHFKVSNGNVQLLKKHKSEVKREKMILTEE